LERRFGDVVISREPFAAVAALPGTFVEAFCRDCARRRIAIHFSLDFVQICEGHASVNTTERNRAGNHFRCPITVRA
jgi:hypothetical protein